MSISTTGLTVGQHALIETELRLQREHLWQALNSQLEGQGRVAHAQALLEQDPHETREHEADREIDQGRGEQLIEELRVVDAALARLARPDFGHCSDCGDAIPFDRLVKQPQALRCLACQAGAERGLHP